MITGPLKSKIDKLWEEFWTGGITNPLTVIEQITFLMYIRLLDLTENRNEKRARQLNTDFKPIFGKEEQHLRWKHLTKLSGKELLPRMRDKVFPHFKSKIEKETVLGQFMKDAQLLIQKESLLASAVTMIDSLPLEKGDTKGDLYEYLLSKLTTAGINGQFRTPRHIIDLMVELVQPKPNHTIADPSAGTGGFLVGVMLYLLKKYTSPEGIIHDSNGDKIYTGDLLDNHREHINRDMFYGFEFDLTMLRIAAMNLYLHGVEHPNVHFQDSLSSSFEDRHPESASDFFDVILANPPFKGSLDFEDVDPTLLGKVKTKKTELLFIFLMLRMLKLGGRCASIVPDGVLFGASKAHVALRETLIDENQLEAIISLPSGVFKPYAGVSTAIIVFSKGGKTENVWFYDVANDGYSLDDKRTPIDDNDIPDVLKRWQKRDPGKDTDRTAKAFFVPTDEIRANKYDLSISRYKEIVHQEEVYESPQIILNNMKELEKEIMFQIVEIDRLIHEKS
ncbi:MAG: SAM-dependent DNA methyltransferase [Calditrichaeota bacterium]|nr:SAM-dependent DNA methyltransferase [Calditrichota bacterium]